MKRFLILATVLFSITGFAQKAENKIKESEVPKAVSDAFSERYAGMKALKWELDNGRYEVDFKKPDGSKYIAVYDKDGKWMGTGTELKLKDVPKNILDHIAAGEYKSWKLNQARTLETPEITKEIVVEVEKGDDDVMLYYDAEGKFLRAKKE
jgi:hypothetical protein